VTNLIAPLEVSIDEEFYGAGVVEEASGGDDAPDRLVYRIL
jgi:hypothetical protein